MKGIAAPHHVLEGRVGMCLDSFFKPLVCRGFRVGLYEKLYSDMQDALKRKDAVKLSTLRMLIAAVRSRELEKKAKSLEDADIIQIIQKQIKQRKDSTEQFIKGSRQDLADKERLEMKVLESYMPEQLGLEDLSKVVDEAIREAGAQSKKDSGKVIKSVMEKVRGRADGRAVNQLVSERLK